MRWGKQEIEHIEKEEKEGIKWCSGNGDGEGEKRSKRVSQ